MSSSLIKSFFDKRIVSYAERNLPIAETYNDTPIYGIDYSHLGGVNKSIEQWAEMQAGLEQLEPSTLLSLVATFDSAFSDLARVLLKSKPQRYSGSDKQYSVAEILKMSSLDEVIDRAIDDEIDSLMNKSHTDQVGYFEKSFDISIKKSYERWPDFVEIFERRNLVAHGSLRINSRYINNCNSAGCDKIDAPIGTRLVVDNQYLKNSIDILLEFGILLAFSAWQKQIPGSVEESFDTIVEVSFNLLKSGHARVADRILEHCVSLKKPCPDATKKRMIVNLAIAKKVQDENADLSKTLSQTDWSAADFTFKMCVAAVKGDMDELCAIIPLVKAAGLLGLQEIREWPAFRWARKEDRFAETIQSCFGEPLRVTTKKLSVSAPEGEEDKTSISTEE